MDSLDFRALILFLKTYIGPMLISVNPFQILSQYGEQLIPDYSRKPTASLPPHLFAVAQNAYASLVSGGTPSFP